jgi:4-amino-4-deoxychorismate lyase
MYFETIKCLNGKAYNLNYHNQRILNTIDANSFLNLELLKLNTDKINPPNLELLKCKVVYNHKQILSITYTPYIEKEIKTLKLVYDDNINYNKKLVNRDSINFLFNRAKKENSNSNINIDEIIIVKNSFITDTSIANIAFFDNIKNKWISPKKCLLKGVTRQKYLDNGKIELEDINVEMAKKLTKIALLNAMIGFKIIENFIIKD